MEKKDRIKGLCHELSLVQPVWGGGGSGAIGR